jgi:hypothetical protein
MHLIVILNGHFQGKYIDEAGMFTLTSLKFCIRGEPLQPGVCPAKDVQHWDKIVFMITSPDIARRVNLTANTELDIKVLDDPHKVSDVKQKVLDFLKIPTAPKAALRIVGVDYAIICTTTPPSSGTSTQGAVTTKR